MSTVSLDLVAEILCRLPVDCVLCFRCVSKSWCALIDSPEFAKLHLKHSPKTNSNFWVLLRETEYFGYKKRCFYSLNIDSLNYRVVTPKELTNPLRSSDFDTKIVGSCNGLLLISNTVYDVALWNPSTGKYKKLPVLNVGREEDGHIRFGFGYNVVNNDYKVVRIVQFVGTEKGRLFSDVNVYSLKSNSWKGIDKEFPYYVRNKEEPGTYLNGALHWVISSEIKIPLQQQIVAFDLETETCRIVPHPPYTDERFSVRLEVLGGCLCTFHSFWDDFFYDEWGNLDRGLDHMDIWVMKEYGVKDSWSKIMSIERPDKDIGRVFVPLAYSNSGEEVLLEQDNKRFVWTGIKNGNTKVVDTRFGILHGFLHFNSYVYLGGLVQLGSSDDTSYLKKEQFSQDKGGQRKTLRKKGDDFLSKGFKLKL